MGKIFISHSSANNAEALAIHDWLAAQGWGDVFLDLDPRRGLVAGDRWQAALKAAAEQCELILILISPDWAKSKWCLAEFLLAKQMNKQILGVLVKPTPLGDLPVELTAEWQLVDLSAPNPGWSVTISPPRFEPETTIQFSGTGLARLSAGLQKAGLDPDNFLWPPASDPQRAPYRGLLPLDADDAGIFFGRDGAIVLTLDALRGLRAAAAPRFTTILGASGAGKSSFLRAGLLPRLDRDSRHFYVLPVIRPERAALTGEHGFAAMLALALKARNLTRNRADLRDAAIAGAAAVAPLLKQLAIAEDAGDGGADGPPTLVIAIDQAEELLTADNAEAGQLLTLLADLGQRDDPAVLVILTVRSDSFDQLQARPELAPTQPHHLVDLPPVPFGSFGDIIRGPARRVTAAGRKLTLDETLVDALLSDIEKGGAKDALPLLAFTLERLYRDYGADGDLQLSEYGKLGRIRGAIEAAVEQALGKADANPAIPRDRAARLALLRRGLIPWLAGIDPDTGSPRRRVARLAEVPEEARPLIELMVAERLLATDIDKQTGERTIEPAHEALLRQWGALDGWLVEDSADLGLVEALRRAATDWAANANAAEYVVHKGARLATAEQLAADDKFAAYLTSVDRAYLSAARDAENAAARKARAARTRLTIAAAVVGVVLVAGATAGYFIWSAGEGAKVLAAANFEIARSEAALRAGQPEEAAQAALAAYDLLPSTATRTAALTAAMAVPPNASIIFPVAERIADAAFLDSDHLLVLSARGAVTTLDLAMRKATGGTALSASPPPIALSPDGTLVVHADASLTGLEGSLVAAAPVEEFAARAGSVSAGRGGKVIAMIGLIGDVLVRDCRSLPCIDHRLAEGSATALALTADGARLAVGRDTGEVAFYSDFAAAPVVVPSGDGGVVSLAWFAGADRLAIGTEGNSLLLLDPAQPAALARIELTVHPGVVAASPTAPLIAVSCAGRDICIYGDDGGLRQELAGHNNAIAAIRWSADGASLASVAPNDPIRIWTLAPDRDIAFDRRAGSDPLTALAVDRARGIIAAGDKTGALTLWSGEAPPQHLGPPDGVDAPVTSLAFLSDGRLAAVYQSKAVAVWSLDKTTPDKLLTLDNLSFSRVAALTGDIRAAVPLSDKTILVLSGDELRETRVAADSMPLDQWGLAAAPAANTAFVSYSDGTIRRRDLGAGGEGTIVFDAKASICGAAPTTDNNGAKSLDVSADGKWLVATRTDAQVIVHNLTDPLKPICIALPAPDSKTVAFSPDTSKLAILSATDRLFVFDLAHPDDAIILGAPAVPDHSPVAAAAGKSRTTSWLAWLDDKTLAISTIAGTVETIALDTDSWRARVDSLVFTQ
ncbi:MAG: TIR domain-containing protein [Devosia nanyangense]|uniref:TIR domain-containing protein n=1 Tax=Devosia nanyangense TaxID=1228055 RepID=A0A933L565_9HYPH|nr:TIR domain-containing protein [Devosia nanyangense]